MRTFRRALVLLMLIAAPFAMPRPVHAQVAVAITVAPPPLPVYVQPAIPGPGWIWAPGYWAWGPYGYYWVPGTWVLPPRVGLLWTPGWWGWDDGRYFWHAGYWGPHVGFYGGINYGFGYFGAGYVGGFWDHDRFHYDRAYNNFGGVHITNVYNRTVVVHNVTRVAFNGGRGGIVARPTADDARFAHERHFGATSLQVRHANVARGNPALRSSFNHGRPPIAATMRPAAFTGRGVVRAQGAPAYHPRPAVRHANAPAQHGPVQRGPAQRGLAQHGPGPAYHPQSHGPAPYHPQAHGPAPYRPQPVAHGPAPYHPQAVAHGPAGPRPQAAQAYHPQPQGGGRGGPPHGGGGPGGPGGPPSQGGGDREHHP